MNENATKYALIGSGKTGHFIADLLGDSCTVFNRSHPVSAEALKDHDVVICFVPSSSFDEVLPMLLECKKPVVIGTTGISIDSDVVSQLTAEGVKWIIGTNFAMGMSLIYHLIKVFSHCSNIFDHYSFSLNEIHHTKKIDTPSGTALSWGDWLGDEKMVITSERIGDVVGTHQLVLKTPSEKITLEHQSLDRSVFARGAIWAANRLLNDQTIPIGLTKFEELTREALYE